MATTMFTMPDKPKKPRSADRHKPGKMVRIRKVLAAPVEAAAADAALDATEWVNIAIREKLEREGRWPPKSK